MKTNKKS